MDLHEAKTRLQQHLTDGLVAVVGSGLSCAEGLPSMGELGDHLRSILGPSLAGDDASAWSAIAPLIQAKGLEAALLEKPPTSTLESAIIAATAALVSEREQVVISTVFSGARKLRLTRLMAHLVKPASGLPIITTNYDRLIEIAVEEAGIGADTMFRGRFAGVLDEKESRLSFCRNVTFRKRSAKYHYRQRALICKPHGSLDWYLRDGGPVCYAGNLQDATRLIITPGHNKFRNGYESPFDHHRSRANDAIDRASRFLILGYGFSDDHLETHLKPAIKGGKPTLMITQRLSAKAESLARDHSNVIALDQATEAGVAGTRMIVERSQTFFPGLALWDVDSFIAEVLEP